MMRWEKYFRAALLACLLALVARLLFLSLTDEHARLPQAGAYDSVSFLGEYSIDGAAFQPLDGISLPIDEETAHTVILRGRFSQDILPNQAVLMKIDFLSVRLLVNGVEKFSYGARETIPAFRHTGGNVVQSYLSDGITVKDEVELVLYNVYPLEARAMYADFLNGFYVGSERAFYMDYFEAWAIPVVASMLVIGMGAFSFIVGAGLWKINRGLSKKILCYGGMAISGGIWTLSDYHFMSLISRYTYFNEFIASASVLAMLYFTTFYVRTFFISKKGKIILLVLADLQLINFLFLSVQQYCGIADTFDHVSRVLSFFTLLACVILASVIYEAFWLRNTETKLIMFTILPAFGALMFDVMRVLKGETYYLQDDFFFGIGVIMFIFAQIGTIVYGVYQTDRKLHKMRALEKEAQENRIAVMRSQIQPHFLYNALTSIRVLCVRNPELARAAITDFSYYLRGNMDSLTQKGLIPFAQELAHLKHYLAIEKLRFHDKFEIVWKIKAVDFCLPAITIQPMVENAIRHGMAGQDCPLVVVVSTEEAGGGIYIRIADNGKGFSVETPRDKDRHIGIYNTHGRIMEMCGGTLSIESGDENGTVVTIFIPKYGGEGVLLDLVDRSEDKLKER